MGVLTFIPDDVERREAFLRRPHVVRDDGDGVVEANDLAHAFYGARFAIIHTRQPAAYDG